MEFLEKDLEQIIYENAITSEGRKKLSERGLYVRGKIFRQVPLGSYGRLDLLTVTSVPAETDISPHLIISIYELKQRVVGIDALIQAGRYAKGIERFLEEKGYDLSNREVVYHFNLIGYEIDMGDFCLLCDFLNNVTLYTYSYDIDGIRFEYKKGFHQKNETLPSFDLSFSDTREFYGIMKKRK